MKYIKIFPHKFIPDLFLVDEFHGSNASVGKAAPMRGNHNPNSNNLRKLWNKRKLDKSTIHSRNKLPA